MLIARKKNLFDNVVIILFTFDFICLFYKACRQGYDVVKLCNKNKL
jgi:hypothetical protein